MNAIQHVNRIKGLLFSQGVHPGMTVACAIGERGWMQRQTGDGRRLPQHLKAQVCRELDRLELLLEQIKAVEAERDAPLDAEHYRRRPRRRCCVQWSSATGARLGPPGPEGPPDNFLR